MTTLYHLWFDYKNGRHLYIIAQKQKYSKVVLKVGSKMRQNTRIFAHVAILIVVATFTKSQDINCNQPPPMVDPHTCCQDGGRDEVADVCAEKWGLKGNPPPDMETAA
uniref:Uncharacterized protein n=1 Tax=Megaselia scalaris TaxID=36166 RepID=T1GWQ6_MEGSC